MNAQTRKITFLLSLFLLMLMGSGKESQFLDFEDSSRVLQTTYTDAQLQQSPYGASGWASNIINYKSNWPLQLQQAPFDGQDCFTVQDAWSFTETFFVNYGFIYSTLAQGYLALRLINQNYVLVVESTLDQTAQKWTIPYPNPINGVPLPLGWVPIYQEINGVFYGITQLISPYDNGALSPSNKLAVGVAVVDPNSPAINQKWNFHATGVSAPANYPLCYVVVQGSVADSTTNNQISGASLTGASLTFTPSSGQITYLATVDSTGSFSIKLPAGTYAMTSTISNYQPKTTTVTVSGSSGSLTLNPFYLTPINTNVVISGYLSNLATNQGISSADLSSNSPSVTFSSVPASQNYQATIDPTTGIYTVTLPPGTYTRTVTMKGYLPDTQTVDITTSLDQSNNFNTVSLEQATWKAVITWGANTQYPAWAACQLPDTTWVTNYGSRAFSTQVDIAGTGGSGYFININFHNLYTMPGTYLCKVTTLGELPIADSTLQVQLYMGSTLVSTVKAPYYSNSPQEAVTDTWLVFQLNVSATDDETYIILDELD